MEIILNILIFILLAVVAIIALVLFVSLVVIFTPLRYRVEAVKDGDKINAKGKLSWLMHIFSISFEYNEEISYKIKIFGISKKKKKQKAKPVPEPKVEPKKEPESEQKLEPEGEAPQKQELSSEQEQQKQSTTKQKTNNQQHKQNPTNSLKKIIDTIKQLHNYPQKKHILHLFITYLKNMAKAAKPKQLDLQAEIGIGPYETGILLATIAVISPATSCNITGNFEEKVINGKLYAKGKLTIARFIKPTISFLIKKPIRKLMRTLISAL